MSIKKYMPFGYRGQTYTPKERAIQTLVIFVALAVLATVLVALLDKSEPAHAASPARCETASCGKTTFVKYRKSDFYNHRYGGTAKARTFPFGRYFTNPRYAEKKTRARLNTYFQNHPKKRVYDGEPRSINWWLARAGSNNCVAPASWDGFLRVERNGGNACSYQFYGGGKMHYLTKREFHTVGNIAICGGLVVLGWYSGGTAWAAAAGTGACGWALYWDSQN